MSEAWIVATEDGSSTAYDTEAEAEREADEMVKSRRAKYAVGVMGSETRGNGALAASGVGTVPVEGRRSARPGERQPCDSEGER